MLSFLFLYYLSFFNFQVFFSNASLLIDVVILVYFTIVFVCRRRLIEIRNNEVVKEELEIVIAEIAETKPFTALGFFNVERCCLITVITTAFTYVIVLLQGVA